MTPKIVKVKSKIITGQNKQVNDLTIEDNHNLFASSEINDSSVLVHNCLNENLSKLKAYGIKAPYSLEVICAQNGCYVYEDIEFSKGDRGKITQEGLSKRFIEYGIVDVICLVAIQEEQIKQAKRTRYKRFLLYLCEQISDTLISLAQMENTGAPVDKKQIYKLKSKDGPINTSIVKQLDSFKQSKAAQKVNNYLTQRQGLPKNGGIFGNKKWLFDVNKQDHQQYLFYRALKLKPLDLKKNKEGKIDKAFLKEYSPTVKEAALYQDYKAACTLRNNFINKMFDKLHKDNDTLHDGNLRSSYTYTKTVSGRLCLDGNSMIAVLDSRCIVPIKDIRPGDWVWSFDKNLDPMPTKVTWQGKTKFTKTVTIYYQGSGYGSVIQTLICTPCHKIRLRSGKYVKAKDLKPKDRVLHLERNYLNKGYRQVKFTGMRNKRHLWGNTVKSWEHRLVTRCNKDLLPHHKDGIKDNNVPNNLEVMEPLSHYKYHGRTQSKEHRKKTSETLRRKYANGEIKVERRFGKDHYRYVEISRRAVVEALLESGWRPTIAAKILNISFPTIIGRMKKFELDLKKERLRYNGNNEFITDEMLKKASKMSSYVKAGKFLKISYYKAKSLLEGDFNHEIIKVINNEGKRWTYDIEVEKNSNFIANGICVHNSSVSLNLQNLVARGDWAPHLKRAFISKKRCVIYVIDFSANEIRDWCNQSGDSVLRKSFYLGLKLRQELQILQLENPDNWSFWLKFQQDTNWFDKDKKDHKSHWTIEKEKSGHSEYDQKIKLIKTINNSITKKIAEKYLEIEVKADIHKQNCVLLYQLKSTLDVDDDMRYDIKAIAFGKVYDKGIIGYAKPKSQGGLGKSEEECKEIMDNFDNTFIEGTQWLKDNKNVAIKQIGIETPLGMFRHLAGYLHIRPAVINAMHRRSNNSLIQGTSSHMGVTALRSLQSIYWNLWVKYNIDVKWQTFDNYVHDAIYSQSLVSFLPIALYIKFHCMTTLVHRRFSSTFGYNFKVGLEGEANIGAAQSECKTPWQFDLDTLLALTYKTIKFQKEELGYVYTKKEEFEMIDTLKYNWGIISKIRLLELKKAVQYKNANKIMLLCEENARDIGLKIEGNDGKIKKYGNVKYLDSIIKDGSIWTANKQNKLALEELASSGQRV